MSFFSCTPIVAETLPVGNIVSGTGEILTDPKPNGKERPWKKYKQLSEILFRIFKGAKEIDPACISPSAYAALERCCSWLLFRKYIESQVMKLDRAEFCKHRLCPVCNWRKSLKLFSQTKAASAELMKDFPKARYLFLTLTVKNVRGDELADTIDQMNAGFKLLTNAGKNNASAKPIRANLLGYAKAMEIKYDAEKRITSEMFTKRKQYYIGRGLKAGDPNPNYDKYHPHFHVLLMVRGDFFKGKNYIKQSQWTSIWRDCMKLDYDPQVDVRTVKPNKNRQTEAEETEEQAMAAAISETLKYPVKPDGLKLEVFENLTAEGREKITEAVICLSHALRGRRLVTFGGELLKARKKLKQDDLETGDLIGVDDEPAPESEFELVLYNWMKMGCYVC